VLYAICAGGEDAVNGVIARAVKSIHAVEEKNVVSWNNDASLSLSWREKEARDVLTAPGPVL
jgi:predicted GNAT superfamily acetyltransferase